MKESKRNTCLVAAILVLTTLSAHVARSQESPYVEMTGREIKSLPSEVIEQYLEGSGMGLALAGELNGYPGPKHVLELAQELGISLTQRAATEKVFERMQEEARRLGGEIVERERHLDALFASGEIDEARLVRLTEDIGRLNGRLRGVHLKAHLEMTEVLDPNQRTRYHSLRGYGENRGHSEHSGHRGQE